VTEDADARRRLVAGDKAEWDRFVTRYAPVIYAAVHRRLVLAGRVGEVEDVTQEVFVRLCAKDFRLLKAFDPSRARMSTWLTVISSSAAIDHLRRQPRPAVGLDQVQDAALTVEPKITERVKIPPDLLSPRQGLILELLYEREMDVAEVARLLGVESQTVRSMHHKALTKLRAHFQYDD
jgi:RNA polymerase sigma-70 factor (ECF subfamily)